MSRSALSACSASSPGTRRRQVKVGNQANQRSNAEGAENTEDAKEIPPRLCVCGDSLVGLRWKTSLVRTLRRNRDIRF